MPVLVAGQLIPKGTTGDVVGSQEMYTVSKMPANRVEDGAITDPNSIKGKAMAIAVASADNFDAPRFWTLVAVIVSAYVISRGIAKSGTKSRAADPREDLDLFNRGEHQHHHN